MSNFFKALLAGLTNQHDISDSFAVTPLVFSLALTQVTEGEGFG